MDLRFIHRHIWYNFVKFWLCRIHFPVRYFNAIVHESGHKFAAWMSGLESDFSVSSVTWDARSIGGNVYVEGRTVLSNFFLVHASGPFFNLILFNISLFFLSIVISMELTFLTLLWGFFLLWFCLDNLHFFYDNIRPSVRFGQSSDGRGMLHLMAEARGIARKEGLQRVESLFGRLMRVLMSLNSNHYKKLLGD